MLKRGRARYQNTLYLESSLILNELPSGARYLRPLAPLCSEIILSKTLKTLFYYNDTTRCHAVKRTRGETFFP